MLNIMGWLEGAGMIVSSLCVMRMIDNVDEARVSEGLVPVLKVHGVHLVLLAAEMVNETLDVVLLLLRDSLGIL